MLDLDSPITLVGLAEFEAHASLVGLELPEAVSKARHLLDVSEREKTTASRPVFGMTDKQLRDYITERSIATHQGYSGSTRGLESGVSEVQQQILTELRTEIAPHLDEMVTQLQPEFDRIVEPIVRGAQTYGFAMSMTSDDVIEMADENASATWRESKAAWSAVRPIAKFRQVLSKTFAVSPTLDELERQTLIGARVGSAVDMSVAFAAGNNWHTDGTYYVDNRIGGAIDWFAVAAGGLHLNTPTEVDEKLRSREATLARDLGDI